MLEHEMYVAGGRRRDGVVLNELWCLDTGEQLYFLVMVRVRRRRYRFTGAHA